MTTATITDLRRELEKARIALIASQSHLASHAEANAALHCATTVMYSPLHTTVTAAIQQIEHALLRTEHAITTPTLDSRSPDGPWAALVADLDRCMHGRHSLDTCGSCGSQSKGNHLLPPGTVIGHGLRRDLIVVPQPEDRHDPKAWRCPAPTEEPTP